MRRFSRLVLAATLVVLVCGCASIRAQKELSSLREQMATLEAREKTTTLQLEQAQSSADGLIRQLQALRESGGDTKALEAALGRRDGILEQMRSELAMTRSRVDSLRPKVTEKEIQVAEEKRDKTKEGLGTLQSLLGVVLALSGIGSGLASRRATA